MVTRRDLLSTGWRMAAFAAGASLADRVFSNPVRPDGSEEATIRAIVLQFLRDHDVPGMSIAIAKNGVMAYVQGYGFADIGAGTVVKPIHQFRIASLSKPITSVAIMTLVENGTLSLDQRVFGPDGLLGTEYGNPGGPNASNITLQHLLTHKAGGWTNDDRDPMFHDPDLTQGDLIQKTLRDRPIENSPGAKFAYSNFGYCLLGRVIEKVSGLAYTEFTRQHVFGPCQMTSMQIAGNTQAERAPSEVAYYGRAGEDPYSMNVARMDAHGGWIGTATDLVRFLLRVDRFTTVPDLLGDDTMSLMLKPSDADNSYACGWKVNGKPNWWHIGSMPGSSSVMVRTGSGLCWAALCNSRSFADNKCGNISCDLDDMMWEVVRAVPGWEAA